MNARDALRLPDHIPGFGPVKPFAGAFAHVGDTTTAAVRIHSVTPGQKKVLPSLRAAFDAVQLKDGATISFHHHLRDGDQVLNQVMAEIAARGLRGIRIAATSLFPVHAPLIEHIGRGVVGGICASYIAGPLGEAIARGVLNEPAVLVTHGGRARSLQSGDIRVDVAFVAAPTADTYGNINGVQGKSACGTLGYPMVDARYAERVVAITDNLVDYPACPIDISQESVDFVVPVASLGDPQGIVSGITRATRDPVGLQIATTATQVIEASGLLEQGFSFQTGAGGISLAVADVLKGVMQRRGIVGSFASGGITGYLVDMLEAGLFRALFDVQCFDLRAVDSYRRNPAHQSMSASMYANALSRGAVVNQLDAVILGASEIDLDFNVNVATGSDGRIIGGSGGHSDCAAGAKLAIVTTRLRAGAFPKVVDRVTTRTTPGETIDVLVTEAGVAVNPLREELADRLRAAGLPVVSIERLRDLAGTPALPPRRIDDGRAVAVLQYRDGTVIDTIRCSTQAGQA
jgi:citrate lyase subunit alpha / citrate CoA-transferase